MIIDYEDYLDARQWIFPLHRMEPGTMKCLCGTENCPAPGKHPVMSNWQNIQEWDEDQLAFLTDEEGLTGVNQFLDGFGVNITNKLLVVDVDARNGGIESYKKLCADLGEDIKESSGFVVKTGSGNGSEHIYFLAPSPPMALVTTLKQYPGIDFKSSGFVVGCGSLHVSGDRYVAAKGSPSELTPPPVKLLGLLKKQERLRTFESGQAIDYSFEELANVVMAISNKSRDYERWIRVGMGIHEATSGTDDGYQLWVRWSAQCDAHNETNMDYKWHSFGKNKVDNVTLATLIHYAKEDGYSEPVTFECSTVWQDSDAENVTNKTVREGVNLKRPPGLVGEVVDWINSRSMFPRENLAVGAGLMAVSNAAGLRYRVEGTNTTINLMVFGIASSATGKESVLQRLIDCHLSAGIGGAQHGAIKSEQEITRNILRNQAAIYTIDELGSTLSKLSNASKRGGATYLEGVMASLMSIFSKANGTYPIGGDLKEEMRERIQKDVAREQKRLDEGNGSEDRLQSALNELAQIDDGIKDPFLSLYGITEPYTLSGAIDRGMMVSGFLGRSLVMEEHDNVPKRKPLSSISYEELPDRLKMRLFSLYSGGFSVDKGDRVERKGDVVYIKLDPAASKALDDVYDYWDKIATIEQDNGSGLEPVAMRSWETTIKIAGTLAVGTGLMTLEHVRYAHALVYRSTMWKLNKAKADDGAESFVDDATRGEGVLSAVKSVLDKTKPMTVGVIANRYRKKYTKDQIQEAINWMVEHRQIEKTEETKGNGRVYQYYRLL